VRREEYPFGHSCRSPSPSRPREPRPLSPPSQASTRVSTSISARERYPHWHPPTAPPRSPPPHLYSSVKSALNLSRVSHCASTDSVSSFWASTTGGEGVRGRGRGGVTSVCVGARVRAVRVHVSCVCTRACAHASRRCLCTPEHACGHGRRPGGRPGAPTRSGLPGRVPVNQDRLAAPRTLTLARVLGVGVLKPAVGVGHLGAVKLLHHRRVAAHLGEGGHKWAKKGGWGQSPPPLSVGRV
jgi:hypothetical protein